MRTFSLSENPWTEDSVYFPIPAGVFRAENRLVFALQGDDQVGVGKHVISDTPAARRVHEHSDIFGSFLRPVRRGIPGMSSYAYQEAGSLSLACALRRRTILPGGNPGRQTLAPAGSTRGGSGGDEWPEALRETAPQGVSGPCGPQRE
jgi:hypothetical protein